MAFPKEGMANDLQYTTKDNFESMLFSDWEEGKNTSVVVDVKYYSYFKTGDIENKQTNLQSNIDLPLNFEEISGENQTYYVAPFEKKLDGETHIEKYGIAAYIQKESDPGGIFVIYSIYCESHCEESKKAEFKEAYDWIQTIKFIDESQEDVK